MWSWGCLEWTHSNLIATSSLFERFVPGGRIREFQKCIFLDKRTKHKKLKSFVRQKPQIIKNLRILNGRSGAKAGFPLGDAQRKAYCFWSNSAKSVRWKVGSSSTFPPRKIPQTNHIAHFAYLVIKTIAAPYGWFRLVENRLKKIKKGKGKILILMVYTVVNYVQKPLKCRRVS